MQIRDIVHATDFSPCARRALAPAAELAQRMGARLHLFHALLPQRPLVAEPLAWSPPAVTQLELRQHAQHQMEDLARLVQRLGVPVITCITPAPDAAEAVNEYARRVPADLLVVGTHGRDGASRVLLGSVAERVVRRAPCPVLTIRANGNGAAHRPAPGRLLVGFDFSTVSRRALAWAAELARTTGASIELLHVLEEIPILDVAGGYALRDGEDQRRERIASLETQLRDVARRLADGVPVEVTVRPGYPAQILLERTRVDGVDWVVLGTRGASGFRRLVFGSTAEMVMRHCTTPVVLLNALCASECEDAPSAAARGGALVL